MHLRPDELITTAGAVGAIGSPWWLPWLQTVSEFAAIIAPILGVIWLLVQITFKLREAFKK